MGERGSPFEVASTTTTWPLSLVSLSNEVKPTSQVSPTTPLPTNDWVPNELPKSESFSTWTRKTMSPNLSSDEIWLPTTSTKPDPRPPRSNDWSPPSEFNESEPKKLLNNELTTPKKLILPTERSWLS